MFGNHLTKKICIFFISISSLLPKTGELKCIASKTQAAITGLTESKLDHTLPNLEFNLPRYDIPRYDRNKNGSGVA